MRLDKFLQVSRLVKRRTMARTLCDRGRVTLNGVSAKASASIHVEDRIEIDWGGRRVVAKVVAVPERPQPSGELVEILERVQVDEWW